MFVGDSWCLLEPVGANRNLLKRLAVVGASRSQLKTSAVFLLRRRFSQYSLYIFDVFDLSTASAHRFFCPTDNLPSGAPAKRCFQAPPISIDGPSAHLFSQLLVISSLKLPPTKAFFLCTPPYRRCIVTLVIHYLLKKFKKNSSKAFIYWEESVSRWNWEKLILHQLL